MNTRERFAATFAFKEVDRPMLDFDAEPAVETALQRYLGVNDMVEVAAFLGVDTRRIAPDCIGPELPRFPEGGEQDVWGIVRRPIRNVTGVYMEPVNSPWADMRSVDDVESYPWPKYDWYDFSIFSGLCENYRDQVIVFGRPGLMDLINGVSFGRGVEQVLIDIAMRDEVCQALFRKRFEFMYEFARCGLEAGRGMIDILFIGEDLGTQQGLLVSADTWEELFRPYLQRMIDLGHRYGAKVMMHSCGSVSELIPRFIEMGLDALQAVQPGAANMSPESLAGRFGGRIVFDGTMDVQGTLPYGTPDDVRDWGCNVKRQF